jgi:UPF0176 protein
MPGSILNVSFYRFVALRDLEALREETKSRAIAAGLRGSVLLSEEGINGFLAGPEAPLRAYLDWLFSKEPFRGIRPKESWSDEVPFARMLVKIKREIISMGRPEIRPAERTGRNLSPAELKRWYDDGRDFVIVDTRNEYEVAEGTFKQAIHYGIETFREFPEKLEGAAPSLRDKTVVMFCTGGIRCEKATALAMDLGIEDVWQLEGGILKYFEEVGQAHYRGDCFVFDQRENLVPTLEAREERKLRERMRGISVVVDESAPEARRVLLALRAKGLPFEARAGGSAPVVFTHRRAGREDLVLSSAPIILDYLEEAYPELRRLAPADPERRARMRLWTEWVDGTLRPEGERWIRESRALSEAERFALETRLEKMLHRLKTPLQRSRRFLVVDEPSHADLAAYSVLEPLRKAGFPAEYPERYELLWKWMEAMRTLAPVKGRLSGE